MQAPMRARGRATPPCAPASGAGARAAVPPPSGGARLPRPRSVEVPRDRRAGAPAAHLRSPGASAARGRHAARAWLRLLGDAARRADAARRRGRGGKSPPGVRVVAAREGPTVLRSSWAPRRAAARTAWQWRVAAAHAAARLRARQAGRQPRVRTTPSSSSAPRIAAGPASQIAPRPPPPAPRALWATPPERCAQHAPRPTCALHSARRAASNKHPAPADATGGSTTAHAYFALSAATVSMYLVMAASLAMPERAPCRQRPRLGKSAGARPF